MDSRPSHPVSFSRTTQSYILMPQYLNAAGALFGGNLLSWIDMVAGIVSMRHCDSRVVTASIDHLDFHTGAHNSDIVTLEGCVTWTGNTSLEVRVDSFKENKGGMKIPINTAYLVMVSLDDDDKPKQVPEIIPETAEELREFEAAEIRNNLRKLRRKEHF